MINMDQVRTLEMKVKQTVQLIVQLRRENDSLRSRLSDAEVRLLELDSVLDGYKATQSEMESGIRSALMELDHVGDGVLPAPSTEEKIVEMAPTVSETEIDEFQESAPETAEVLAEEFLVSEETQEWTTPPDEAQADESPAEEDPEPQQPGLGIF